MEEGFAGVSCVVGGSLFADIVGLVVCGELRGDEELVSDLSGFCPFTNPFLGILSVISYRAPHQDVDLGGVTYIVLVVVCSVNEVAASFVECIEQLEGSFLIH